MKELPIVDLRFRNLAGLKRVFLEDMGVGGLLWVNPDRTVGLGEEFAFRMRVLGREQPLRLRGRIVWRKARPPGRADLPEGAGVEFFDEDAEAVAALAEELAQAKDELGEDERQATRYVVHYPCEFLVEKRLVHGATVDLSEAGLRLRASAVPNEGTLFTILLSYDSAAIPQVIQAETTWVGQANDERECGAKLVFDSDEFRAEFAAFIQNRVARVAAPVARNDTSGGGMGGSGTVDLFGPMELER